jgi:hypothetical protein
VSTLVRRLSATILVGAVAGATIGGLGGRLAMRILFLTSDDAVKGVESDDGFAIGRFSYVDTAGLILVATFLGVVAALAYFAVHPALGERGRWHVLLAATYFGVVGGAVIVHRGGVDFTLLEPAWLAIALFVVICAAFGATIAVVLGGALADDGWPLRRSWRLLAPPFAALVFPPALVAAAVAFGVHAATSSPAGTRVALVARPIAVLVAAGVFLVAAVDLVRDTAALV